MWRMLHLPYPIRKGSAKYQKGENVYVLRRASIVLFVQAQPSAYATSSSSSTGSLVLDEAAAVLSYSAKAG